MYLVDTNLVSELRRAKNAHPRIRAWSDGLPAESLDLSVISILELEIGILLLERRDRRQGAVLRA
jgi:predicted nucleic acid-binding protein